MDATAEIKRTGPTVERECGWCEGVGEPGCPSCGGAGRIAVEVRPFVTMEAMAEHLAAVRVAMGLRRTETFKPKAGTPAYHLDAAEDYASSLFQQLILLLPEERARTEGD